MTFYSELFLGYGGSANESRVCQVVQHSHGPSSQNVSSLEVKITNEHFGVDSVATETYESSRSRTSRPVISKLR